MADSAVGRVDADGRLVSADARLLALHERAGGKLGEALAVAPLAMLSRLARSLDILVSRSVTVAEGDHDLDLWVRARPDGATVVLTVGGWTMRAPRTPRLTNALAETTPTSSDAEGWTWGTDASLRITALSFDAPELIGQPLTRIVRLIEDDSGDLPIIEAIAGGRDFKGQRAVRRGLDDAELVLRATAIRGEDGRFLGFSGAATGAMPLGEDDADADALPDMGVDAAFADRLDRALREPLARIVASADSIGAQAEGPLRRDYADYAGDIASAARHLLALVDDLSDLQAVEREDFTPEIEDVDLADIARRGAGLLAVRASSRSVRIDRPDATESLMARGEFRRVLQIVVNLIGNAVRYSPEGSMVWLRTERDDDTAVLIVADQGKGIDPADHERIFEKFERVNPSEPGGSGLGLYIARRLARAMGGDIAVDSAPGQGARFVLTLPVV